MLLKAAYQSPPTMRYERSLRNATKKGLQSAVLTTPGIFTSDCMSCPAVVVGACCSTTVSDFCLDDRKAGECDGIFLPGERCSAMTCPGVIPLFTDPLPILQIAMPTSGAIGAEATYDLTVTETQHQFHSSLPSTTVWAYNGQVCVAKRCD